MLTKVSTQLYNYLLFLGLTSEDFKKAEKKIETVKETGQSDSSSEAGEEKEKIPSNLKAIQRLFASSLQFLNCESLVDWVCLEKKPIAKPSSKYRQELSSDLGEPIIAGESLEAEVYFTKAFDGKTPRAGMVETFAEKIHLNAQKSLSIAMFGIDDIDGSMKPVYQAILEKSQMAQMRAVVDVAGFEKGGPWVLDYRQPNDEFFTEDKWVFGLSKSGIGMKANFQYDGTPNFILTNNQNIENNEQSKVRIEFPTGHIMHNKFAVLEDDDGQKYVWTGTANISKNCMGIERNSNMSIYIKNNHIAQAFLDEFNLMYNFDNAQAAKIKSKLVQPIPNEAHLIAGRFHHNKYPVSKRLFTFNDGTQLRVHFAPTADAEHRVILPMLLSARAGDKIRISMFGGTGYEIVRALQFAIAKGASVRIVFDRQLGYGTTSWIRDSRLNLFDKNPYLKHTETTLKTAGTLEVRVSNWEGKNHYKTGTLERRQEDGSYIVEQIIVGSQNWSTGGNDHNDENLISIQHFTKNVIAGQTFNSEFDDQLWKNSRPFIPKK